MLYRLYLLNCLDIGFNWLRCTLCTPLNSALFMNVIFFYSNMTRRHFCWAKYFAQLIAPLNPRRITVPWCSRGLMGVFLTGPLLLSTYASLSDSCTSDRCRFSRLSGKSFVPSRISVRHNEGPPWTPQHHITVMLEVSRGLETCTHYTERR